MHFILNPWSDSLGLGIEDSEQEANEAEASLVSPKLTNCSQYWVTLPIWISNIFPSVPFRFLIWIRWLLLLFEVNKSSIFSPEVLFCSLLSLLVHPQQVRAGHLCCWPILSSFWYGYNDWIMHSPWFCVAGSKTNVLQTRLFDNTASADEQSWWAWHARWELFSE